MHYYKRNLGDYAKKAGRLSMLEHGAYTLLIDACYDRERFPTEAEAIEWAWARTEAEIAAVRFVLNRFFTLTDGVYVQGRIAEEVATYQRNAETNARIAKEREEKRKNGARTVNEPCNSCDEPPPNQEPRTNNQEPKKKSASPRASLLAIPPTLLADYLAVRKAKRAGPLTKTAAAILEREAEKAGISVADAVTACCEYGWQGFNAGWYAERNAGRHSQPEAVFAGAI